MVKTDATGRIAPIVAPTLEAMGFELVRVRLGSGKMPVLQIMAERPDGSMSVDDCAEVSRAVSALLDVEDPIQAAYRLEISSPGIDRPLTRPKDFERWAGFEAKLETHMPVQGRKRFRGRLGGIRNGIVSLAAEEGGMELPFEDIAEARLVLTDDLIAAAMKRERDKS